MVGEVADFDEFLARRCTDISDNIIVKNISIQIKEKQLLDIVRKLKLNLINENLKLFMDYCDLCDCIGSESEHIIYRQGFHDGVSFKK